MKKIVCAVVALCLVLGCLCSCQDVQGAISERLIVGEWTSKTNVMGVVTETTYTFNEDKTGSISGLFGIELATTYNIDDTHLIVVTDTPTLQKTFKYTYEIDGEKLILVDDDGTQTIFTKVR